jgi:hypothetical protein
MPDPRRYRDEDIQAIIQRALDRQDIPKGELTHADLLAIGEQLGLSADAIDEAAQHVVEARRADEATKRIKSSRRRWLAAHAAVFTVVNALLFTVNALTTPGEWWFLFSVFFWGLALGAHAAFATLAGVSPKRQQRERMRLDAEANALTRQRLRVEGTEAVTGSLDEAPPESAQPEVAQQLGSPPQK